MMVGDGLNDAGALKQADVGVAVVEQVGAFSPASDVILDAAELPRLARVLEFSRQAARVVRAGFAISAVYNVAGVSIAAAGLLEPMVCAILMPVSSATIVAFACGLTAWLGRKLRAGELSVESSGRSHPQLSTLNPQLDPKGGRMSVVIILILVSLGRGGRFSRRLHLGGAQRAIRGHADARDARVARRRDRQKILCRKPEAKPLRFRFSNKHRSGTKNEQQMKTKVNIQHLNRRRGAGSGGNHGRRLWRRQRQLAGQHHLTGGQPDLFRGSPHHQ